MSEGIHITRARLHELLTDAHIALVEHRAEQAGAIIGALRKITAPEPHPARAPLPFLAPSLAAEEAQPAHQQHLTAEPECAAHTAPRSSTADGAPVAPAPSPAQAAKGLPIAGAHSPEPPRVNVGRAGGIWTPERKALLTELWPQGVRARDVLDRLNQMPGALPVSSEMAVMRQAAELGLRRPPEVKRAFRSECGQAGAVAAVKAGQEGRAKIGAPVKVFTEERLSTLVRMWEAGEPAEAIFDALNALPGERPVSNIKVLQTKACALRLARPEWFKQQAQQRAGEIMRHRAAERRAAAEAAPSTPPPAPPQPAPAAAAPEPPPAPPPVPLTRPVMPGDEKADAFAYFDGGKTVRDVVGDFDVSLTVAVGWHQEWKRARMEKAA